MRSPYLAQALYGGGLGSSVQDPATLKAMQKSGLAQALLGQGMDSSPAAPMQALGRLAQAIAGSYMLDQGMNDLDALSKQRETDAGDASKFILGGGGMPQPPAATPVQPQAPTPSIPRAYNGGGSPMANAPDVMPIVQAASRQHGIPEPLITAMLQQESSLGTNPKAGGNIGQVIASTAADPGFGMQPMSQQDLLDPTKNINFSVEYLKRRGEAAGVKDWNDPNQWPMALKGYNGGGDPNYVENVSRFLPQGTRMAEPGRVQMAAGGNVATDASTSVTPQAAQSPYDSPEIKGAMQTIERARQVLGDPRYRYNEAAQNAAKAAIEDAKVKLQAATHVADKQNAALTKQDDRAYQRGQTEEQRRWEQSQKPSATIRAMGPDGKEGIYELTPGGGLGKRLGDAGGGDETNNILTSLAPKVQDGSASPAERLRYSLAYGDKTKGTLQPIQDPNDPSKVVFAVIPGIVPPEFPKPDFKPAPAGAGAPQDQPVALQPNAAPQQSPATPSPSPTSAPAVGAQTPPNPTGQGAPIIVPGTSQAPKDKLNENERKAAGFGLRMGEAMKEIDDFETKGVHTGNWGANIKSQVPVVGNAMLSPEAQVYRQRAMDWIRAKLRKESGAVIGDVEAADELKNYFPVPGDSPENILAKKKSRQAALLAMQEEAGRAVIDPGKLPYNQGAEPAAPKTPSLEEMRQELARRQAAKKP